MLPHPAQFSMDVSVVVAVRPAEAQLGVPEGTAEPNASHPPACTASFERVRRALFIHPEHQKEK